MSTAPLHDISLCHDILILGLYITDIFVQTLWPGGHYLTADTKARAEREHKSFVTLSTFVIGYVVCWVPFHFVYDVSFIRPELISEELFMATFWLT